MDFFQEGKEFYLMTEYAASDRAICKLCKKKIYKDSLKLAYIIYSECYTNPQWHHFKCLQYLPHKYPVMIQEDVVGLGDLDEMDQQLILEKLIILNRRDKKRARMAWDGKFKKDDEDQDYQPSDNQNQSQSSSDSNYSEIDSNFVEENENQNIQRKNKIKKQPIKQVKVDKDEEQEKEKEKSRLNAVKIQNWKNILKKKQQ